MTAAWLPAWCREVGGSMVPAKDSAAQVCHEQHLGMGRGEQLHERHGRVANDSTAIRMSHTPTCAARSSFSSTSLTSFSSQLRNSWASCKQPVQ